MEAMITSKRIDLWFLVLLVISVSTIRVDSQPDSNGFISIDCGLAPNSSLIDSETKLTFMSDDEFIDTGVNYGISSQYAINGIYSKYLTLRSFPNGIRNCYTLRSLKVGSKYLIRGLFMYGNYDNLTKFPTFDVHLGVNYWDTIEITTPNGAFFTEIIAAATSDYLQVCLVNKNLGTPFISTLELRPLTTNIYLWTNITQSLVHWYRRNLGASDQLRYPDDPYDRIWSPYTNATWTNVSTSSKVDPDADYATPSLVMQTAATTLNTTQPLEQYWTSSNTSTVFAVILHFSEIENLSSTASRKFDVYANGFLLNSTYQFAAGWAYSQKGYNDYNVSLKATSSSTLPPMLNALEVYVITPATGVRTNSEDVAAMNIIKANYKVNKDWSGDPCAPKELLWTGVACTSDSTKTPRITALNLSSSGLKGAIVSSFGDLSALQLLDISYNDLSGDLPIFLDKLSALTYLDITGNNKISTTLPPALHNKSQNGNLIFRFGSAPPPPSPPPSTKNKSSILIIEVSVVVVLLLISAGIIIAVVCFRRHKDTRINPPTPPKDPKKSSTGSTSQVLDDSESTVKSEAGGQGLIYFDKKQFSFAELKLITNCFREKIGVGGFGEVFKGRLENGNEVAVKVRSESSSQGSQQFLNEVEKLSRVHHKNLVSLVGYCKDGNCIALIYEYMQEGNLQDWLRGNAQPLSWKQRLRIAHESAQGLEYLHKMCNPPLIHRDVKTSNILLTKNLEAKVSDFGLVRDFSGTSVSTKVVGTPGYLDPHYASTSQLIEKSDVYSFGVVLLEIVTGKMPIRQGQHGSQHLTQFVKQRLSKGNIESILDPYMGGQYNLNSIWKVAELALRCNDLPAKRPDMTAVVTELKESLNLEMSSIETGSMDSGSISEYSGNFEMAQIEGPGLPDYGPLAR